MENNPTPPDAAREAAERIRDLAGSPDFDAVAMVNQLAPILARDYLARNPRLVWRRFEGPMTISEGQSYQIRITPMPSRIYSFSEVSAFRAMYAFPVEIACTADGVPWPVRLAEVEG